MPGSGRTVSSSTILHKRDLITYLSISTINPVAVPIFVPTYLSIDNNPKLHMLMVRVTLSTKALRSQTTSPASHLSAIVVIMLVGITTAPEIM